MSKPLYIAGLDLSGPANLADTHLSIWSVGAAGLALHESLSGLAAPGRPALAPLRLRLLGPDSVEARLAE